MDDKGFLIDTFLDGCRKIGKYNTITNELYVIKDEKGIYEPARGPYTIEDFINKYVSAGVIYSEDIPQFEYIFEKENIRNLCKTKQNGSLLVYRKWQGDELIWVTINMYVPKYYSDENPYIAIFNRDMPKSESMVFDGISLLGKQVHKLVKVNMTKDEITVLKEYPFEAYLRTRQSDGKTQYSYEINRVTEKYVYKEDAAAFSRHMTEEYICNYFKEGNSEYHFYYRRLIKGFYRWVRLTVIPVGNYSENNREFYYYISDMHKAILKFLDIQAATKYAEFFSKRSEKFTEGYYEHLLEILSVFTQPYIDYYMIDLEKDIYINYKMHDINSNREIPYVGCYSQISKEYLRKNYKSISIETLNLYTSIETLRDMLKERLSMEHTYTYPDGKRVTNIFVKLESKDGIPTKILCSTLPANEEHRLIIETFGNFSVKHPDGTPLSFTRKQSKQLLAYLVDRHGYPVTSKDIVVDILEKDPDDLNAIKYVSTLIRRAMQDLEKAGYPNVIIKEQKTVQLNVEAVDCDYYHFLNGDRFYWRKYKNEYMKEYSWAEETNAELLNFMNK